MFENLKLKLAARWLKENQVQPKLVLSASDKIYLATAKKTIKKLTYIYTLACSNFYRRPRYRLLIINVTQNCITTQ